MKAKLTRMKKGLSIALAIMLLAGLISPVGQLFPVGTVEAAFCLPMPKAPGCILYDRVMAGVASSNPRYYSLGESMEESSSTGGAWASSRYGDLGMDGVTVNGRSGSWSVTFEKKNFTEELSGEIMCRMGCAVNNYNDSYVRMGNGTSFGEECNKDGLTKDYATDWLPYNGMKAVVKGRGVAYATYPWFLLADLTSPGENDGWKMETTTDEGAGTPVLWLSCNEILRPANANITTALLANIKLRLGLVPRKTPGAEPVYATAAAVELSSDNHGIGFRIEDSDWEKIAGTEYQIVSIQNASVQGQYKLAECTGGEIFEEKRRTVALPVTDIAGNPVWFPGTETNVKAKGLFVDVQPPYVETVKLTGTTVDVSQQIPAEEWPEDIDRSRLFSSVGDEVQMRLQLSEVVVHPSREEMGNIFLTWNLKRDGVPVTSRLIAIEEGYSNGVNGGIVSTLVFEKIKITGNMTPQGERLHAVSLTGGEFLRDYSKNFVAQGGQTLDVSDVSPNCQNYLDTMGPVAEIGQAVLMEKTDTEVYYMVPFSIMDGSDGMQAAGVSGQTGQISLTSYVNAPQMTYAYEISTSMNIPDSLSKSGMIGGEGNEVWSPFSMTGNGVYYLHLRLTDIGGKELDDVQGLTLKLLLTDIVDNSSETSLPLTNLGLDQVAPGLSLAQKSISVTGTGVSDGNAGSNTAVFEVLAEAADTNGVVRMEYQWTDAGDSVAENNWTVVSTVSDGSAPVTQMLSDSVSGQNLISRTLYVRAYDTYENYTEKSLTIGADLSRAVGQFQVTGDPETPSADTDVLIAKPIATDEGSDTSNASTRATVEIDGKTYVRIFKNDAMESLLDHDAADWYLVETAADGKYGSVTQETPDWSFYGTVTITLAHSMGDLTPVEGAEVKNDTDTSFAEDPAFTLLYAPGCADVHAVSFGGVENSAGEALSTTEASGYTYYKINRSMTGVRFSYALINAKMPEWNQKDVDFGESYAVLVKTDAQGGHQDDMEITERVPLGNSEFQSFAVPSSDKDGNNFVTGAYVLKVYVKQKAGGEQTFYSEVPLLLDATGIPTQFGVRSYTDTTHVVYTNNADSGEGLSRTFQAAEGDVLHTVNVGVAKPDDFDMGIDTGTGMPSETPGTVMQIDGHDAYLTSTQNALSGSRFAHQGYKFVLRLTAWWNEEEKPDQCLGVQFGRVQGIKYWNAASSGDPAAMGYQTAVLDGGGISSGIAGYIDLEADIKWYDESMGAGVVSREELAQKDVSDFALALGGNTICYQLMMENGLESPVYQFDWNLCDQAPTLELDYSFGPVVIQKDLIDDYGLPAAAITKYAEYIDVSVKDAFSAYGGLTLYHVRYDESGKQWIYDEVEQGGRIRLTRSGNGYAGFRGTRTDIDYGPVSKNYTTREFICAVDAVGNAVSAYPILADAALGDIEDKYYFGIKSDCTFFKAKEPSVVNADVSEYSIVFNGAEGDSLIHTVDYYTMQIDDREPVWVDTEWPGYYFQDISNNAGIVSNKSNEVDFVLPYDPAVQEGEQVTHTVKITAYGYKETSDSLPVTETAEFTVTGINRKPYVEVDTDREDLISIGHVPLKKTAVVQDTSAGIYYWSYDVGVYNNGTYTLRLKDKYGDEYVQGLTIDCLPDDPEIAISTTKPTVGPVTVTATGERYLLWSSVPDGVGNVKEQPTSTGEDSKELVITVPENCSFNIYWYEEGTEDKLGGSYTNITINNIDSAAIEPEVQWQYDEYMVEDGNIYRGEVTAILVDQNGRRLIDPLTGSRPSYVFVPGGDTEYVFSGYVDEYGQTGADITAVLPVTLRPYESPVEDVYAPDLAITSYVIRKGVSEEIQAAYVQAHERPEGIRVGLPDYGNENKYGAENVFDDIQEMMDKMSWADSYLLRIDVADESAVRLFVKKDTSGGVPDYETGTSDEIEGVSLTGRTLQISKNAEFVLYAVDEKGNYSMVSIPVTLIGRLPDPKYAQVLTKAGNEVRIYLLPPALEGVSNLQITNDEDNDKVPDALTEDDPGSEYFGRSYLSVKENKTVILYYSYDYLDGKYSGSLTIPVSGIDSDPAVVARTIWSANYDSAGEKFTNQEISVQIQFDKLLGKVTLTDADGKETGTDPAAPAVAWLENRVTVVYGENAPGYRLKVQALANDRETVVELPEIKTIDRVSPQVSASIVYAENHRSAVITITSDEECCLSRTGSKGTSFQQTVKEDGIYTYSVADRAGNLGEATVSVEGLVTEELTLNLSTEGTDETVINSETYAAKVGERLYARTNRPAELFINGNGSGTLEAGIWMPFTISEDSEGLYPSVRAVDDYGNAALVQMLRIPMGDRKAPVLLLNKKQLSASSQESDGELRAMLLANAVYSDETTGADRLKVEIAFERNGNGNRIPVTYTVTDEAGNETVAACWLRLYDGSEPQVTVNGNPVEWGETMAVPSGTQMFHILSDGEPYKVYQKAGIKTEAQMKTGSVTLRGYTAEKEQEIAVEISKPGYYTFCIVTQEHGTYSFILYVEE